MLVYMVIEAVGFGFAYNLHQASSVTKRWIQKRGHISRREKKGASQ